MKLDNRTKKRKTGDIGENIACNYLLSKGFHVLDRNYLRKWGELDIVAQLGDTIHFVEVKTISCVTFDDVSGEAYRPEENMHIWKIKRLSRAIQTYLLEKNIEKYWQLDLITVVVSRGDRRARVKFIENIVV